MILGIDYSLTSPALCLYEEGDFGFDNVKFFYLTSLKKTLRSDGKFNGTLYPEFNNPLHRYNNISNWVIRDVIIPFQVRKVYIEDYAFAAVGKVFNIAENTGVLKYRIWKECNIECETIPPTVIKKAATGKGNANKEAMQQAFIHETGFNLKEHLQLTDSQWNPSSDLIDSYYICKFGALNYVKKE